MRSVELNGSGNGNVGGPITSGTGSFGFSLYKDGTGTWTLTGANTYSSGTQVSNGTLVIAAPGALPAYCSLTVAANATIIAANLGSGSQNNLFVSSLKLSGTSGAWSGKLNLNDNDLDVQNGNLSILTNQVKQGCNANGSAIWNGSAGIMSSAAAADTTHLTALGVIQNSVDGTITGSPLYGSGTTLGTFDGTSPAATDVLIKYTYYGDTNLDGKVDGTDYSRIDAGFLNPTLTGWYNGDFNYDGVVNGSDYTLIDNAFNMQGAVMSDSIAGADASVSSEIGATSAVPEPADLGIAGIVTGGLLGSRRRKRCW